MASAPDFSKAKWRKSTGSDSGGCVEVAYADGYIGVRDTKDKGVGPVLAFTPHEWEAFLYGVGNREFTLDELRK